MREKAQIKNETVERDFTTGEIVRTKHTIKYNPEPQFVKLYLDCLGLFTQNDGLDKSLNDMLLETLRYMSFADDDQKIYLNSEIKKNICKKTGKSVARYNQALTLWVKKQVLVRDGRGTYRVNPYLFGRGDWRDISKLRATFDFTTGEVVTEKEYATSDDTTKADAVDQKRQKTA